jgi:hypothetical protein
MVRAVRRLEEQSTLNQLSLSTAILLLASQALAAELEANRFIKVAESDAGGHFFSQVIYAPSTQTLVSLTSRGAWLICAILRNCRQYCGVLNRRHFGGDDP